MKIFVTGGAGFIGSALVKSFLEKNYTVMIFDNFSNSSEENVSTLLNKGASLVKGDVRKFEDIEKALNDYDLVIHLAAQISVEESIKKPELTHSINVGGTENLLKACVAKKVNKIILASSAAVYGQPKELPLTESSPISPISPYGQSKVEMEKLLEEFSKNYGLNGISLRFFNIYGKGQTDEYAGVITKFMKNISENKPLIIFGDGSNTRDFISIVDVVDSILSAIEKIEGKKGNYYNVATGNFISIKELAELMLSISDKNLGIKYESPKKGDILHSQTSINLLQKELGFYPKIKLSDGLKELRES
ncbi:MAG: UDP-glucose 4-epimerase [Nitrosopumilales archaeon]|nr:MAG: UDP-glucose 4-epimerase [Nitrosopumilales archaeon]